MRRDIGFMLSIPPTAPGARADRRGWLELVLEGSPQVPSERHSIAGASNHTRSARCASRTPSFTFTRTRLSAFVPMLDQQTEFDDHTWATLREVLEAWRSPSLSKVPPSIVSILSDHLGMSDGAEFDDVVRSLASIDQDRILSGSHTGSRCSRSQQPHSLPLTTRMPTRSARRMGNNIPDRSRGS